MKSEVNMLKLLLLNYASLQTITRKHSWTQLRFI